MHDSAPGINLRNQPAQYRRSKIETSQQSPIFIAKIWIWFMMNPKTALIRKLMAQESKHQHPVEEPMWFNTSKGNFLQFIGMICFCTSVPLLFFANTLSLGIVAFLGGLAVYGVGRFANWWFWYRLQ